MSINVNKLMHVNTAISGNMFIPVPISAVGIDEGEFIDVNTNNFVDFTELNNAKTMNYSSFDGLDSPNSNNFKRNDYINANITREAFGGDRIYENPFKISEAALKEFNNYDSPLKMSVSSIIDEFSVKSESGDTYEGRATFIQNAVVRSLFNPYLTLNVKGIVDNVPLTNSKDFKNGDGEVESDLASYGSVVRFDTEPDSTLHFNRWANKSDYDTSNCSIKKLVELSNEKMPGTNYSKLGRAIYRYADFMYCKDLGKVSNNYLITLRRFPHPVGDNIFSVIGNEYLEGGDADYNEINTTPDIGRMVAWLGDDNKLEDILKFSFKDSWKQVEGGFYETNSEEDSPARGPLGSILNIANPKYRAAVAKGTAGSGNTILQKLGLNTPIANLPLLSNNGTYESNPVMLGQRYDHNKIYEPKGTIRDTHLYEGKLTFSHDFTLTFNYELRAYENINPKSAFLDLIGNILKVTYRTGSWWGGEQRIYGAPANKAGWKRANELIDKGQAGAEAFAHKFINGEADLSTIFGKLGNMLKNFVGSSMQGIVNVINNGMDALSGDTKAKLNNGVEATSKVLGGMFRNAVGRPAVYALDSVLSGAPVGLWHVTIGNPRNPILAMGNLIIDNTSIQQYGPLGIDDFPTGIKVVVSLKHAKSRDAAEIANMYTKGIGMIHIKPSVNEPSKYFSSYTDEEKFRLFGTSNASILEKTFSN